MNNNYIIVMTTFSKEETGKKLIDTLLTEQLAACIQAVAAKSSYTWKGAVCHDPETLLLIKTKAALYQDVEKTILRLHDYETPEIVCVAITQGSHSYFTWIDSVTK